MLGWWVGGSSYWDVGRSSGEAGRALAVEVRGVVGFGLWFWTLGLAGAGARVPAVAVRFRSPLFGALWFLLPLYLG